MSEPFDIMIEVAKIIDPTAWSGYWMQKPAYQEHLRNQALSKANDILRLMETVKPVTAL